MLPPFSSGNPAPSTMFPGSTTPAGGVDRVGSSIWSNGPSVANQRPQTASPSLDHRAPTWGAYQGSAAASIPEFQPSWAYAQQHPGHMRENHSSWQSSEHEHAWKYSRSQAPPPPPGTGVWQYPSSAAQHQEYHDWGSRAAQQPNTQQPGYYYVSSGHDQRGEDYIPYDIGARARGFHQPPAHLMPPAPPGYPLPPHMQYYGQPAPTVDTSAAHSPSLPAHSAVAARPPSSSLPGSPSTVPKTGGAASFLFEAAAAAIAKASSVDTPSHDDNAKESHVGKELKESVASGEDNRAPPPHSTSVHRRGGPMGPSAAQSGPRVNNHQVRLHATGNEKVPLATATSSGQVTTLMIRNIPNRYTQSELMTELREAGFDNKFDFFYLPMDHETHANFGYAFINFLDEREVGPFTKRFNGLKLNRFTSNKIIQIVPAQLQGFQANLQHYCKKAVCTDDNVDYRPMFFVDGKCLEFHRASEFVDPAAPATKPPRSAGAPISPRSGEEGEGARRGGKGSGSRGVFQRKNRGE